MYVWSLVDLLWSDPEAQVDSWAISPRGGGFLFGHLPTNAVRNMPIIHWMCVLTE